MINLDKFMEGKTYFNGKTLSSLDFFFVEIFINAYPLKYDWVSLYPNIIRHQKMMLEQFPYVKSNYDGFNQRVDTFLANADKH